MDHQFPIFRKYVNGKTFFKIVSIDELHEIQVMGSRRLEHHTKATQYPEKVLIMDLIKMGDGVMESSEVEFEGVRSLD
ncbi:MAG: hypothetical protein ACI9RU_000472 [Litorivivens sp.]|jgi:hypothetical protein